MEASPVERSTTDRFHWSVSSALGAQARTILLPSGLKNCCQLRTTPPSKWYRVVREPSAYWATVRSWIRPPSMVSP